MKMSAFDNMLKVLDCKRKMLKRGLNKAKANCPQCKAKDRMFLYLAPSRRHNGALRWHCKDCGFAGME